MKRHLLIAAGAAILLLSGCMVGPKYAKPTAPLAPGFKEATDLKAPSGTRSCLGLILVSDYCGESAAQRQPIVAVRLFPH